MDVFHLKRGGVLLQYVLMFLTQGQSHYDSLACVTVVRW